MTSGSCSARSASASILRGRHQSHRCTRDPRAFPATPLACLLGGLRRRRLEPTAGRSRARRRPREQGVRLPGGAPPRSRRLRSAKRGACTRPSWTRAVGCTWRPTTSSPRQPSGVGARSETALSCRPRSAAPPAGRYRRPPRARAFAPDDDDRPRPATRIRLRRGRAPRSMRSTTAAGCAGGTIPAAWSLVSPTSSSASLSSHCCRRVTNSSSLPHRPGHEGELSRRLPQQRPGRLADGARRTRARLARDRERPHLRGDDAESLRDPLTRKEVCP